MARIAFGTGLVVVEPQGRPPFSIQIPEGLTLTMAERLHGELGEAIAWAKANGVC